MLPVELVVRGFLSGSALGRLQRLGLGCGQALPPGLQESGRLPEPIVTPATKAEEGHDLNITEAEAEALCGVEHYSVAREAALRLYAYASAHAETRGLILADTKFEFGIDREGIVTLGDEALTPDSSRFWPGDVYRPGGPQPSFDKQYVRDFCLSTGWDRTYPAPRCRTMSWPARAAGTSRRSSDSPGSASTPISPTRGWCCESDRADPSERRHSRSPG